jgi:sugar phosphate isomerase/epimerase
MSAKNSIHRRDFLKTAAAASAAMFARQPFVAAQQPARFKIIGFTKPFQSVGFAQTADIVAQLGWSGIESPVRAKGQVLPERVEDDLPALHRALAAKNLELSLITTDVGSVTPLNERVLRTAAKLGVKKYRLTFKHYDLAKPLKPQLAEWKAQLRDLAALNKELGLTGGIQNHSGRDYVGAPVWDIHELVSDLDPTQLGVCFDIGHATLEGGTSWPIEARLMESHFTCVYVKDFAWEKTAKGWKAKWGPLGEGMVNPEFFRWLKQSSYRGPISLHCEYLQGADPEQLAAMKKDTELLASWLA